jgi:hypothetical protein
VTIDDNKIVVFVGRETKPREVVGAIFGQGKGEANNEACYLIENLVKLFQNRG